MPGKLNRWFMALALLAMAAANSAHAEATDIASTVTEIGTYKTAAITIGIAVFLFVLGRKVVRKLI